MSKHLPALPHSEQKRPGVYAGQHRMSLKVEQFLIRLELWDAGEQLDKRLVLPRDGRLIAPVVGPCVNSVMKRMR